MSFRPEPKKTPVQWAPSTGYPTTTYPYGQMYPYNMMPYGQIPSYYPMPYGHYQPWPVVYWNGWPYFVVPIPQYPGMQQPYLPTTPVPPVPKVPSKPMPMPPVPKPPTKPLPIPPVTPAPKPPSKPMPVVPTPTTPVPSPPNPMLPSSKEAAKPEKQSKPIDPQQVQETVKIENNTFIPDDLTIPAGTTVYWINFDNVNHTVTSLDGIFDSGILQPGENYRYTFNIPGTYAYRCNIYPEMRGVIRVTAKG